MGAITGLQVSSWPRPRPVTHPVFCTLLSVQPGQPLPVFCLWIRTQSAAFFIPPCVAGLHLHEIDSATEPGVG